jgi:hypothetical protein
MIDLVRKRHDGDGWLVFQEVGDKPGLNRDRTADAVALGVWASTKYEAHLYEFKSSRGDLVRELRDPSKAEGIGKYCTYWWLAVSDEKVISELVIPEAWGIVCRKKHGDKGDFRVVTLRKAPRLKPQPIGPMFAISLIRNMAKKWVSPKDHERVKAELEAALDSRNLPPPPDVAKIQADLHTAERALKEIRDGIATFEDKSGVKLPTGRAWEYGHIGVAVKAALDLRERLETDAIRGDISYLSQAAGELEKRALQIAQAAVQLRGLGGEELRACTPRCRSQSSWGRGQCNCGAVPLSEVERKLAADAKIISPSGTPGPDANPLVRRLHAQASGHDHEGGHIDRRCAGAPEQDAGPQLWDLSDEVPHG